MAYFLAGAFHNEFSSNVEALGDYSFSSLASYYGYHINRLQAIGAILLIGIVYHLLLLVLLKVTDLASRKVVMRNVRDARRRAKLFLRQEFDGQEALAVLDRVLYRWLPIMIINLNWRLSAMLRAGH